jgi:hypothetical protein
MKKLNYLPLLAVMQIYFACSQPKADDMNRYEVTTHEFVEEIEEVEPPLDIPREQKFATIHQWLENICDTEQPEKSVVDYRFQVMQTDREYYTVYLYGIKAYEEGNFRSEKVAFRPKDMYYRLSDFQANDQSLQQVCKMVTNQLKDFTKTAAFKKSFFSKANSVLSSCNGENLVKAD